MGYGRGFQFVLDSEATLQRALLAMCPAAVRRSLLSVDMDKESRRYLVLGAAPNSPCQHPTRQATPHQFKARVRVDSRG